MRTIPALAAAGALAVSAVLGTLAVGGGTASAAAKQAKIANAMSAAPAAVAAKATVLDWPADHGGAMTTLRKGSNGWTCLPNDPMTPTDDPQCLDRGGMAWMDAWMMQKAPKLSTPGMAYVLRGCTVASNTDPMAMEPAKGRKWVETGPHVMIFPTAKLDVKAYGTNPRKGTPYVRWAGTAYEHLVVPVPAPA